MEHDPSLESSLAEDDPIYLELVRQRDEALTLYEREITDLRAETAKLRQSLLEAAADVDARAAENERLHRELKTMGNDAVERIRALQAENERLRAWAEDEQAKRHKAEDQRTDERSDNERLWAALDSIANTAAQWQTVDPRSLADIASRALGRDKAR